MKQGLQVLIAAWMCMLTIPAPAATWGDYTYNDNGDGTCTITGYTGPGGDITIPDTLL
jgi:hypothetical protein